MKANFAAVPGKAALGALASLASLASLATGCTAPQGNLSIPEPILCAATPSDNGVVTLSWTAPAGSTSWATFHDDANEDAGYGDTTWTVSDREVTLPLLGVPVGERVFWEGTSEVDGQVSTCTGQTFAAQMTAEVTAQLPADLPVFTVDIHAPDIESADRFFLGAYYDFFAPMPYFVVLNRQGQVVWYARGEPGTLSPDIQFSRDGNGILYNRFSWTEGLAASQIRRIAHDGTPLETLETPNAHHMYAQLPDGVITYTAGDARDITDPEAGTTETWHGDAIVERAADGTAREVFSTWDWLTPEPNAHTDDISIYGGVDWTHGNAIKFDETTQSYLLSLAHPGDVLRIDRATGTPLDVWGPDGLPASPAFDYPHDPTLIDPTHLLMFMTDAATTFSGAIEYTLDAEGLHELWRRGFTEHADYLGQATRLENGNTFVNYGALGVLEEVTPDGAVAWHGTTGENGSATGQFRPFQSFYR